VSGAPSVRSRREGALPERVLDALDLIDEFVMELTRVRTILDPLEATTGRRFQRGLKGAGQLIGTMGWPSPDVGIWTC
jgi:hypothetical protein